MTGIATSSTRRVYWAGLLIFVALIAYGSLYPFDFHLGDGILPRLRAVLSEASVWTSLSDTLGNVALFFPLGVVAALAARSARRPVATATALVCLAIAFAAILQALQIFVPSRSAAVADVLWNAVGCFVGIAIGWMVAPRTSSGPGRLDAWDRAILVFVMLWGVGELLPLVPALDWSGIKSAVKPLIYSPRGDLGELAGRASQLLLVAWLVAARLGTRRAAALLPLGLAFVFVLRLLSVGQRVTPAVPAGYVLGYALWRVALLLPRYNRVGGVLGVAFLGYAISQFAPFELRSSPGAFGWLPFAAMLNGSMLANAASLVSTTVTLGGLLLVAYHSGARLGPIAVALAFWVALFEWAQTWIAGRTGDITPVLLVFGIAAALGWLVPRPSIDPSRRAARPDDLDDSARGRERTRGGPGERRASGLVALAATVAVAGLIAGAIAVVLQQPRIPYNVVEMFRWDARFPVLVVFALAVLWIGAGARWAGERLSTSPRPVRVIPVYVVLASLVSLGLLYASVTVESLNDIAGSNNLYWFVTHKDIWGATARNLFLAIGSPTPVEFFERPVRFTALYGPLVLLLAVMIGTREAHRRGDLTARWFGWTFGVSVLLLWLCKAIAFDWSSTDNLNELIARDGPWGWGGGGYLYALVAMICGTAVLLSGPLASGIDTLGRGAFLLLTIPAGWWLLNEGLEPRVEKYSRVFSGVQFLLGPDRVRLLDESILFLRWVGVQTAAIAVIATGIAIGGLWIRAWRSRHARAADRGRAGAVTGRETLA